MYAIEVNKIDKIFVTRAVFMASAFRANQSRDPYIDRDESRDSGRRIYNRASASRGKIAAGRICSDTGRLCDFRSE